MLYLLEPALAIILRALPTLVASWLAAGVSEPVLRRALSETCVCSAAQCPAHPEVATTLLTLWIFAVSLVGAGFVAGLGAGGVGGYLAAREGRPRATRPAGQRPVVIEEVDDSRGPVTPSTLAAHGAPRR